MSPINHIHHHESEGEKDTRAMRMRKFEEQTSLKLEMLWGKGHKTYLASTKWTSLANTQERHLKGELAGYICGSHSGLQEENTERLQVLSCHVGDMS